MEVHQWYLSKFPTKPTLCSHLIGWAVVEETDTEGSTLTALLLRQRLAGKTGSGHVDEVVGTVLATCICVSVSKTNKSSSSNTLPDFGSERG